MAGGSGYVSPEIYALYCGGMRNSQRHSKKAGPIPVRGTHNLPRKAHDKGHGPRKTDRVSAHDPISITPGLCLVWRCTGEAWSQGRYCRKCWEEIVRDERPACSEKGCNHLASFEDHGKCGNHA